MSLIVITTIKIINNINPIPLIILSTFSGTFFLVIFSIIRRNALPPSNAGNGSKFINPTFIDKYAVKYKSNNILPLAIPTTEYIPTGPDTALNPSLPVNKLIITIINCLNIDTNLLNAYLTDGINPFSSLVLTDIPKYLLPSSSFFALILYFSIFLESFFSISTLIGFSVPLIATHKIISSSFFTLCPLIEISLSPFLAPVSYNGKSYDK